MFLWIFILGSCSHNSSSFPLYFFISAPCKEGYDSEKRSCYSPPEITSPTPHPNPNHSFRNITRHYCGNLHPFRRHHSCYDSGMYPGFHLSAACEGRKAFGNNGSVGCDEQRRMGRRYFFVFLGLKADCFVKSYCSNK